MARTDKDERACRLAGDLMSLRSGGSSPAAMMSVPLPFVTSGQRIGLMGGSFNPPHEGHAMVARTALRRLELDRLWWVVTPGNPLKNRSDLNCLSVRMTACQQFVTSPRMVVTGFEAHLGSTYTAATLKFLLTRLPAVHFVWVMGADNLATFHRWQHWREIARAVPIAVIDRPGWRLPALASPAAHALADWRISEAHAAELAASRPPRWSLLSARLSPLSSTQLREEANRNM